MRIHFDWLFIPLFEQGNDIYLFISPDGKNMNASLNDKFLNDRLAFRIKPKKK